MVHLHNGVSLISFKNEIMKFTGEWIELKKNHTEWANQVPERQICYVFTYVWILAVQSMITMLQSVLP